MKNIFVISLLLVLASCGGGNHIDVNDPDQPVASKGIIGQANVACVGQGGQLIKGRCKLPNGNIVDPMSLL